MARVLTAAIVGVTGVPVEVEVRISSQLPCVDVVGLPEAAVRESISRIRGAIAASGLAYQYADARAPAGQLTVTSENPQSVPHDIAIEGNGVNEKGEIVTNGGTSQFSTTLDAGEYTFFCSVPGHREGGMEGTLTVE